MSKTTKTPASPWFYATALRSEAGLVAGALVAVRFSRSGGFRILGKVAQVVVKETAIWGWVRPHRTAGKFCYLSEAATLEADAHLQRIFKNELGLGPATGFGKAAA